MYNQIQVSQINAVVLNQMHMAALLLLYYIFMKLDVAQEVIYVHIGL